MNRTLPVWPALLLLPLLWLAPLLPAPNDFPFAPGSPYSDLTITHWTNALLIHRSIAESGEVPLWNPQILGGTPLAGDPLSGLYYPPLWLAAAFPDPWSFNLLFFLHMALAGLGAYALARQEGAGRSAALVAGIAFGGLPKFVAHIAAGHLTLVCAAAWTPWLLLAARSALQGGIRRAALAGALVGIVFLADPRWVLPAGLAAVTYALITTPAATMRNTAVAGAIGALFAASIGAVLAMPMITLLRESTRPTLTATDALTLSLPLHSLAGFFLPLGSGSFEWVVYPGAIVFLLGIMGAWTAARLAPRKEGMHAPLESRRAPWFWILLFLASILFALGDSTFVYPFLLRLIPGLDFFRVPPRWMFLAGLSLAMLAARGWREVENRISVLPPHPAPNDKFAKVAFAFAAAGAVTAIAAWRMRLPPALVAAGCMWFASGILLWWILLFRPRIIFAAASVLLILCLDLAFADGGMIQPRSLPEVLSFSGNIAAQFESAARDFRFYSPSYSLPQDAAVFYGWRAIGGISPLILRSTQEAVLSAAGIQSRAYSVTLPPFAGGTPAIDNRDALPDARLMGLLNVRYLVSAYPISAAGWNLIRPANAAYIYEDAFPWPHAWVAADLDSWQMPRIVAEPHIVEDSADRLRITAEGPGELILSEAAYPGWHATVDSVQVPLETAGGWWRAVSLPPGVHIIEMRFLPAEQIAGFAITLLALAALLVLFLLFHGMRPADGSRADIMQIK